MVQCPRPVFSILSREFYVCHTKDSTFRLVGKTFNFPPVACTICWIDRQSQPGSLGLGGEIGFEDFLAAVGGTLGRCREFPARLPRRSDAP